MKIYAPGKLILSGEHAVVYGQPALAMAVNCYATATITPQTLRHISFDLLDLAHRSRLSRTALQELKQRVKRKYQKFIRGEYTIRQVLHKPFELAHVALGMLIERLNLALPHGVNIQVQSDIPIGCGMGSSAATILSVMHAISQYLELSISKETLFQLALEAENMQHGHSSGLDLRVVTQGGCLYMHEDTYFTRDLPSMPLYLVQTGAPVSSTGECVEKVAHHFQSTLLCDDFSAVTKAMDAAIIQDAPAALRSSVRANHQLLNHIGVVPTKVQQFIAELEAAGGAAKICGAGAVAGENGGAVLALIDEKPILSELCLRYGYSCVPLLGDKRGVHAA